MSNTIMLAHNDKMILNKQPAKIMSHKLTSKLIPNAKYFNLILLVIFCELLARQRTCASGVFEFELIDLQRLDQASVSSQNQVISQRQQYQRQAPQLRLLICLKEAFTSQLDGPCVFGNASLTLNQQRSSTATVASDERRQSQAVHILPVSSIQVAEQQQQQQQRQHSDSMSVSNKDSSQQNTTRQQFDDSQQVQRQQQQRSHMTNVVRIPFTFRWTKSFTIILTAEQIRDDETSDSADEQAQNVVVVDSSPSAAGDEPATSNLQANKTARQISDRKDANVSELLLQQEREQQQFSASSLSANHSSHHQLDHKLPRDSQAAAAASLTATATTAIDRHVLTENEVLPNLGTNPNKPWTSRASRGAKSSLVYRFRVFCASNYYGDGCATFCRPRDDQFGHYACSPSGQRVCLDGWTGHDCNRARCKHGCNAQHGFCDQPDTCSCRPGWTGPRCDECIAYPGCQQGYCLAPWQCICHHNWGGFLCDQDLNYCGTREPCLNNGTCQNVAPARYKCQCPEGFTGVNCELKLSSVRMDLTNSMTQLSAGCALNPCLNGGTCFGFEPQQQQHPAVVSISTTTSSQVEQQQVAQSNGTTEEAAKPANSPQQQQQVYRCQCPPGWAGDYCQWTESGEMIPLDLVPGKPIDNATDSPSVSSSFSLTTEQLIDLIKHNELSGGLNVNSTVLTGRNIKGNDQQQQQLSNDEVNTLITLTTATDNGHSGQNEGLSSTGALPNHVEMRHLISGVVIASAVGVFVASLLLAWCCLLAIEKGRFHFIQMNVIRQSSSSGGCGSDSDDSTGDSNRGVSSRLRRVHAKIRDSLRRGSAMKSETKSSIENVLGAPKWPPPSYEESNLNKEKQQQVSNSLHFLRVASHLDQRDENLTAPGVASNLCGLSSSSSSSSSSPPTKFNDSIDWRARGHADANKESISVKRGVLQREIALKKTSSVATNPVLSWKPEVASASHVHEKLPEHHHHSQQYIEPAIDSITRAQINCPKHGHLYRNQHTGQQLQQHDQVAATTIAIEYQSGASPGDSHHYNYHHVNHKHHHDLLPQHHHHHHHDHNLHNDQNISQNNNKT